MDQNIKDKYKDKNRKQSLADRFFSLFRFNITFKLTIEFTLTFISLMILINMMFYVGIKGWMYSQTVAVLKNASYYIEKNTDQNTMDALKFEDIEYFLFTESKQFIKSNIEKSISYKTYEEGIKPLNFLPKDKPEYYYYQRTFSKGDEVVILIMRKNAITSHKEIDFLWSIVMGISVILTFLVWITSSRISQKHLKPIRSMTQKVQDISIKNLDTRLDIRGTKDELKDLAFTFNKMMDEIEDSYENQKQFVSDASHELRTPIAVIKGYASILSRWGKTDKSVLDESIKAIEDETKNMQSLVESLLFLAKRDRGTLQMEMETFHVKNFVNEIIKESGLIDTNHEIDGEINYEGDLYASPDKLKQAIRVFIDNSMKYTPDNGKISISVKASETYIYFAIKDTGVGISKEDLPKIFDRFYRADQARTRSEKTGTGLGLAIARVIIEQHKGEINIESELGKGTTVTIILPNRTNKE